ncbi:hypothetical protein BT67DRAFT_219137 [Trichocladium antarcticum]|uniref:Uncharacterized protein n=1 Tax=Trichocladium antarcticum TaxID=1450529 RepID=A0AAN6Z961_9PEZI|nr:hypothetical protein BT67DRAFT_219137 [Trichocladium antarcticum]
MVSKPLNQPIYGDHYSQAVEQEKCLWDIIVSCCCCWTGPSAKERPYDHEKFRPPVKQVTERTVHVQTHNNGAAQIPAPSQVQTYTVYNDVQIGLSSVTRQCARRGSRPTGSPADNPAQQGHRDDRANRAPTNPVLSTAGGYSGPYNPTGWRGPQSQLIQHHNPQEPVSPVSPSSVENLEPPSPLSPLRP